MVNKIKKMSEYIGLSSEDTQEIVSFAESMPEKECFLKLCSDYENGKISHTDVMEKLVSFSKDNSISEYKLNLAFILYCLNFLRERYIKKGDSEELTRATLEDVAFKVKECKEVKGEVGLFVFNWYRHFFDTGIVRLGRMQYHVFEYLGPDVTIDGVDIHFHDKVINVHIPGDGTPITQEDCLESYKKAYDYFDLKQDGKMVFRCSSWMLFPSNSEILPETSNVVKFMRNYRITKVVYLPKDSNRWRYFGKDYRKEDKDLPENTSMQRAFKKWLLSGKYCGSAEGVFVFDGQKIITY